MNSPPAYQKDVFVSFKPDGPGLIQLDLRVSLTLSPSLLRQQIRALEKPNASKALSLMLSWLLAVVPDFREAAVTAARQIEQRNSLTDFDES